MIALFPNSPWIVKPTEGGEREETTLIPTSSECSTRWANFWRNVSIRQPTESPLCGGWPGSKQGNRSFRSTGFQPVRFTFHVSRFTCPECGRRLGRWPSTSAFHVSRKKRSPSPIPEGRDASAERSKQAPIRASDLGFRISFTVCQG